MRLRNLLLIAALAAPTFSAATSAFADEENEHVVSLSDIPAPAREGLLREAKGAPITKVEEAQKGGQKLYEGHVKQNDEEIGIVVDASGNLVDRHSEKNENE
jgi:hypothetical protein